MNKFEIILQLVDVDCNIRGQRRRLINQMVVCTISRPSQASLEIKLVSPPCSDAQLPYRIDMSRLYDVAVPVYNPSLSIINLLPLSLETRRRE